MSRERRPGESTEDAARRRLFEELGMTCGQLVSGGVYRYRAEIMDLVENELDHLLLTEVTDTRTDPRWRDYMTRAVERGNLSSLSIPLVIDEAEQVSGALNIYAREAGAGRVVYLALGHDMRSWGEPPVRTLVRQALLWASGRD